MENFISLLNDVWNRGFYGVNLSDIIISFIVLLSAFLLRGFIISIVLNSIARLAKKTESNVDDEILLALKKPLGLVPVTIALYIITLILPMSGVIGDAATNIVKAFVIFTIFSALANSIKPIFEALSTSTWLTASMQMWLERASRAIVWIVGSGVILDIFGIQIGPLVAGLGLFSVAVALGAQDFFKNLIAGILIIGENRFQPGDRIQVSGKIHGIVDTIGFRSTVVRQFDTSPMIIPNKDLSDVTVINHAGIINRRIDWKINLTYSTSVEQLEAIRSEIKDFIIASDDFSADGDLEPVVRIIELGSSSIDVMVVCYSDPCGFADFANIKENLIFNIMKIVKKNNSDFAFPSTSLYLESTPDKA